jgi:hypothetical protein
MVRTARVEARIVGRDAPGHRRQLGRIELQLELQLPVESPFRRGCPHELGREDPAAIGGFALGIESIDGFAPEDEREHRKSGAEAERDPNENHAYSYHRRAPTTPVRDGRRGLPAISGCFWAAASDGV